MIKLIQLFFYIICTSLSLESFITQGNLSSKYPFLFCYLFYNLFLLKVPFRPPRTSFQAFESTHYSSNRNVIVHWENVHEFSTLHNFFYVVSLYKPNRQQVISTKTTKLSFVTFENVDSEKCEFHIYSRNNFGLSVDYSTVYLPPSEALLSGPSTLNVFVYRHRYLVEWTAPDTVVNFTSFTIFWCQVKYYIDNCIGTLHWQNTTDNHFSIEHKVDYKFAIAINTAKSTSGLTWAKCIVQLPINELYHVLALTQSSTSILVKWTFYCEAQSRVVDSYTFEYCPSDECEELRSETVNNTFDADQYVIESLRPNTRYKILFSSPQLKEKYEIYGFTDLGIPSKPTEIEYFIANDSPILRWHYCNQYFSYFKIEITSKIPSTPIDFEMNKTEAQCHRKVCFLKISNRFALKPYTEYYFAISSCNLKNVCSYTPNVLLFRTLPGKPGKMLNPPVEKLTESKYRVYFQRPLSPNGPITYFLLYEQNMQNQKLMNYTFVGNLSYADISIVCQNNLQFETFKISIAAVNSIAESSFDLIGDTSQSTSIDLCFNSFVSDKKTSKNLFFIIVIVSIIVFIATVTGITYFAIRYYRHLQEQKKQFNIKIECNNETVKETGKSNNKPNKQFISKMTLSSGPFNSRYYNVNFDMVINNLYAQTIVLQEENTDEHTKNTLDTLKTVVNPLYVSENDNTNT